MVRNVQTQQAVALEMLSEHLDALLCQQVHRYRVAAEGIHGQHVEPLRLGGGNFLLHLDPRIAQHDLHLGRRIASIGEILVGNPDHVRIDFVEADRVARFAVRRQRAATQPDNSDPQRPLVGRGGGAAWVIFERHADAALEPVVGRRPAALGGVEVLETVLDVPVDKLQLGSVGIADLGIVDVFLPIDPQHAIEIARRFQGRVVPCRSLLILEHSPGNARAQDNACGPAQQPPRAHIRRRRGRIWRRRVRLEAHGDKSRQKRGPQADLIFPKVVQHQRRAQRDQNPSQRAAGGDQQVKQGCVPRGRLGPHQLAVTNHAAHPQRGRIRQQLRPQPRMGIDVQDVAGHAQNGQEQQLKRLAMVPTIVLEADNEREQVQRQRQHP